MTESRMSVEEASQVSLDEYIKASGIVIPRERRYRHRRKPNQSFEPMDETDFDPTIPSASSQQWRLLDADRPVGMPPLVPTNSRQKIYNGNRNKNRRNFGRPYADRDKPSNGVMRQSHGNFKNFSGVGNGINMSEGCTAVVAAAAALMCGTNPIATMNQMAKMVSNTTAPMYDLIMESWRQKQKNAPKYDMNVQNQISLIQGKPLVIDSSAGNISLVTSDGTGVDDCVPIVTTTNYSTHQRFT